MIGIKHQAAALVAVLVIASSLFLAGASDAAAGTEPLRAVTTDVVAFQSDGVEFAAWQPAGTAAVTVFDGRGRANHVLALPAGCALMRQGILGAISAGAERFLLECGAREQAVLDARTGAVVDLSRGSGASFEWVDTGRLYAESRRTCASGDCVALENLRTGAVLLRRRYALYDLNRSGAPALRPCPAMRGALSRALQNAEAGAFAASSRVVASATRDDEHVELNRCAKKRLVMRERAIPRDFQLGAGILTWDSGYPLRSSAPEETLPTPSLLVSYRLSDGARHTWALPNVTASGLGEVSGPFGFSAHVGDTVFWLSATSVNGGAAGASLGQATLYAGRD